MVLPIRANDESFVELAHHNVPPPPPPPTMPLPCPPATGPKRALSVDNFTDRGRISPAKPPSTTARPFSVLSQSTEQDLLAIAELLSPTVDASTEENEAPLSEPSQAVKLQPVPDVLFDEASATASVRDSMSASMSSVYSSYHRPSSASVRSSMYTDSDGASLMSDDLPDPSLLYTLHQNVFHGGFHLERLSLPVPPLDDNRSLSSATSYSSLRTPSLSRHSSVHFLSSPPMSPVSSYLPTPAEGSGTASPQPPNSKPLDVIEEARHAEDQELRRVPSDDAQTITIATTPSASSFLSSEPFLVRMPESRSPPHTQSLHRLPELEKLRITTHTPESPTSPASRYGQHIPPPPPMPVSPVLSARSSASGASSHKGSGPGRSGVGKLFGRGDKHKEKDRESKKSGSSGASVMKSNQSVTSFDLETGLSKAEEKRLKKEAARARTERLAQDLADKAKKRAEAVKAAKSARVKEKSSRPWEEEGGMFQGISYF
ncbi:hypothetical protein BD414DRAFT_258322 [Trametes punicea]|nr:hypothetical protein BD414DRAFT_258322 [Trametes punicea]